MELKKKAINLIIIMIPVLMILNISFTDSENDCNRKMDQIREDRTYDYFSLLRLYLIEDTEFETDVTERIVDRTIYLKDKKNLENCEKFGTWSDITIYLALFLYLLLFIFYIFPRFKQPN